jgi:hypothetical protein
MPGIATMVITSSVILETVLRMCGDMVDPKGRGCRTFHTTTEQYDEKETQHSRYRDSVCEVQIWQKADTSSGDKKLGHKANGKVSAHQGATRQGEELAKRGL